MKVGGRFLVLAFPDELRRLLGCIAELHGEFEEQILEQSLVAAQQFQHGMQRKTWKFVRQRNLGKAIRRGAQSHILRLLSRLDIFDQHLTQLVGVDRLGNVIVHACGKAFFTIPENGACGHGDDRQFSEAFLSADVLAGLNAPHHGHLQVHQHDIEGLMLQNPERFLAISRDGHLQSKTLEEFARHLLIDLVVFYQQDVRTFNCGQLFTQVGLNDFGCLPGFPTLEADDGVEQPGCGHRLGQDGINLDIAGFLKQLILAVGGDHDHHRQGGNSMVFCKEAHTPRHFDAIHLWHFPVKKYQFHRLGRGTQVFQQCQRLRPVRRFADPEAPLVQQFGEDRARDIDVIHHQHVHTAQVDGRAVNFRVSGHRECEREGKGTAMSGCRNNRNIAAHFFHQAFADGQAQPGSAIFAGSRAVCLGKSLKQACYLLLGHADAAVAYGETQGRLSPCEGDLLDLNMDLAFLGKLHRITDQIVHHLAQAQRIANQGRCHLMIDLKQELQPLLLGAQHQQVGDVLHQLFEREFGNVELQSSRFDLGVIEDVIEDGKQRCRRDMNFAEVIAQLGW